MASNTSFRRTAQDSMDGHDERPKHVCQPFAEAVPADVAANVPDFEQPIPNSQQQLALHDAMPLGPEWKCPTKASQLTAWGGAVIKFNLRFTFWSKWTWESRPHATPVTSWLQASTLFISVGRLKAPFVVNSELVGVAAYKFRALSRNMLKMCVTQEGQFDDFFPPREQHAKCLPNCPREPYFPAGLFFMLKWNLADTTIQLSRHDFYGNWHVCTCRCKSSRQLGSNRSSLVDGIRMQRRLLSTAG